jgi:adenylate cyclase
MSTPEPASAAASTPPGLDVSWLRHELRTPINHIIGYCELLMEEGQLPPASLQDLRHIHSGGRELQALIARYIDKEQFLHRRDLHSLYHELRTPVNHIIGYSDLLIEQAEDSGSQETVPDLLKIREAAANWLALMEAYLVDPVTTAGQTSEGGPAAAPMLPTLGMGMSLRLPEAKSAHPLFKDEGSILVVDDDENSREMLARRLRRCGYTVSVAPDGLRALLMARRDSFDAVLLDMLMPGLDGFQVLARMKSEPALRLIPVIMLSALDDENGVARSIELGAEDYIAKPFNPIFLKARIGAAIEKKRLKEREAGYLKQIEAEKQRSDELLRIILPTEIAEELKKTSAVQPRRHENVGVLFCDVVGFTPYSDAHAPEEILKHLQGLVEAFETISARHGLEKIKTIGDSFMAAIGLGAPVSNPARSCVECGLEMVAAARHAPPHWQVRVGINVGPVVAGIVGRRKYQYDVWGDTVNLAARMETSAPQCGICMTASTWQMLGGHYPGRPLGEVEIKGKGRLTLFCVEPAPGTETTGKEIPTVT